MKLFIYEPVIFHSGKRNPSEYLRQREFNVGNDYMVDGIIAKPNRRFGFEVMRQLRD